MILFTTYSILVSIYVVFIFLIYYKYNQNIKKAEVHSDVKYDIIVPHRNDSEALKNYLSQIKNLKAFEHYQWIMSEDGNENLFFNEVNIKHIFRNESDNAGKKAAIEKAIPYVQKPYVLCNDADLKFASNQYLIGINAQLQSAKIDLWIGLYQLIPSGNYLLDSLQLAENRILQMITYSMAQWKHPILCSGTNLSYSKTCFLSTMPYENNRHILSGDDMFLLQAFKNKEGVNIVSSNDDDTIVLTYAQSQWKAYFSQRWRWGSKLLFLELPLLQYISIGLLLVNLISPIMLILAIVKMQVIWLIPLVIKTLVESIIGFTGKHALKKKFTLGSVLISQIYGLLFIYMLIFGFAYKNLWKNRIIYQK
jgi:poly-beta-1,6-N-acetyl-D-glucosamine synthase